MMTTSTAAYRPSTSIIEADENQSVGVNERRNLYDVDLHSMMAQAFDHAKQTPGAGITFGIKEDEHRQIARKLLMLLANKFIGSGFNTGKTEDHPGGWELRFPNGARIVVCCDPMYEAK